jgi:hypothetical protein
LNLDNHQENASMRTFVVGKGNSPKSLIALLLGNEAASASAVDLLTNLNPHVDFTKVIEPGTVLLIPDVPGGRGAAGSSVTGNAFDALRDQLLASVKAAGARARSGFDAQLNEQQEVDAVLKSGGLKRALKVDPELRPQVDAAAQGFKQAQQRAKTADATLTALQQQATEELAHLAKTVGG